MLIQECAAWRLARSLAHHGGTLIVMSRVALIHWKAEEAEERAERSRAAGHDVPTYSQHGGAAVRPPQEVT